MRAVIGTLACTAALLVAAPRPTIARTQTTTATSSDKRIDSRITHRLKTDPALKRHHLRVSVDDGVATLRGTVATDRQRERAEALAHAAGAVRVDNQIEVSRDSNTAGTTGRLERKTRDSGESAWDKTKEGADRAGDAVTDTWITGDLKTRFESDSALRAGDIHVTTNDHVVTLTGSVPSEAARVKAVETARKVNGVHRVVDKLVVR